MIDQKKRLFRLVRAALRRLWLWYGLNRKETLAGAKSGKEYLCAACGGLFKLKDVRVDHVTPAGRLKSWGDMNRFTKALFTGKCQVLCVADHDAKTKAERRNRGPKTTEKVV